MSNRVYNNIEGLRVFDGGNVCEDVTSVTLPTVSRTTSKISASGMVMDVEVPNMAHLEAMELAVAHNNGVNCDALSAPGRHAVEIRSVRERLNKQSGEVEHESVKWRVTGLHKSTEKGSVETNNPYGSTDKFSVTRFEEVIDGTTTVLIDAMAGVIKYGNKNYTDLIENYLK